jgi:outer membrane translocation and assembly module TamA
MPLTSPSLPLARAPASMTARPARPPGPLLGLLGLLSLAATPCCAAIPEGRAAIDAVDVVGARSVDPRDIEDKIATGESPKFLGVLPGVANDYTIYDSSVLQHDLARVERYYRGRGFFEAHVRVGRVVHTSETHVRVEIVVDEGPPMHNRDVRLDGLDGLPPAIVSAVKGAATGSLAKGARFDEVTYAKARAEVVKALTDRGYAYAKIAADARADMGAHAIDYTLSVTPGIATVFGPTTFTGLDPDGPGPAPQEIEEPILRRVVAIKEGEPYSTARIASATQALLDLEVFSAVHVVSGLGDPPAPVVPLTIQVEPTKLRTIRLGGGFEFDATKTDLHLLSGWEDHNLLGGLRDLNISFKPGVALYPTNTSDFTSPKRVFPEERLRLQFRQPAFLEARTTGFVEPSLNVYPLLVEPKPNAMDAVPGYVEPKVSIGVERRFGKLFFAKLAYNVQGEVPFDYYVPAGATAAPLPTVVLSFPQLVTQLQLLDDPIRPHAGFSANLDLQKAGGPFGGTANDVRIQPDVEGYIPLGKKITFALTGSLGVLLASNYGQAVKQLPSPCRSDLAPCENELERDIQTVYFRGFFSGGPSSNRGFPLRGVSPHGYVPFLNPATASSQVALCDPNNIPKGMIPTDPACSSPIGGFTMWQASAEVRFAVTGPIGAAVFCDAGDVSQYDIFQRNSLRFNYLHMSCGVGGRYDTPVGPIRLDVGWRVPWLQILGQPNETAVEAHDTTWGVQPRLAGQPLALAFGLGESF